MRWSKKHRPLSEADEGGSGSPTPPSRDPERPQDDPWDANAVRFLLGTPEGAGWRRSDLMECLREQPNRVKRQPDRVAEARPLAEKYGVKRRPDPGGTTIHFFRTDNDPHRPIYPHSAADRRRLLRGEES